MFFTNEHKQTTWKENDWKEMEKWTRMQKPRHSVSIQSSSFAFAWMPCNGFELNWSASHSSAFIFVQWHRKVKTDAAVAAAGAALKQRPFLFSLASKCVKVNKNSEALYKNGEHNGIRINFDVTTKIWQSPVSPRERLCVRQFYLNATNRWKDSSDSNMTKWKRWEKRADTVK